MVHFQGSTIREGARFNSMGSASNCLPEENQGPGAPRWFDAKGMFGLMFLKAYLNLSDEKLIEQYNTDLSLQFFCGKLLKGNERIKDTSIVSRVRSYIADECDWSLLQEVLINHWKRDMTILMF